MKTLTAPIAVFFAAAAIAPHGVVGFTTTLLSSSQTTLCSSSFSSSLLRSGNDDNTESSNGVVSIDVSDLGLTLADLEKKIPIHDFSLESSGYQSTSRIPDVNDDGCYWVENA